MTIKNVFFLALALLSFSLKAQNDSLKPFADIDFTKDEWIVTFNEFDFHEGYDQYRGVIIDKNVLNKFKNEIVRYDDGSKNRPRGIYHILVTRNNINGFDEDNYYKIGDLKKYIKMPADENEIRFSLSHLGALLDSLKKNKILYSYSPQIIDSVNTYHYQFTFAGKRIMETGETDIEQHDENLRQKVAAIVMKAYPFLKKEDILVYGGVNSYASVNISCKKKMNSNLIMRSSKCYTILKTSDLSVKQNLPRKQNTVCLFITCKAPVLSE